MLLSISRRDHGLSWCCDVEPLRPLVKMLVWEYSRFSRRTHRRFSKPSPEALSLCAPFLYTHSQRFPRLPFLSPPSRGRRRWQRLHTVNTVYRLFARGQTHLGSSLVQHRLLHLYSSQCSGIGKSVKSLFTCGFHICKPCFAPLAEGLEGKIRLTVYHPPRMLTRPPLLRSLKAPNAVVLFYPIELGRGR